MWVETAARGRPTRQHDTNLVFVMVIVAVMVFLLLSSELGGMSCLVESNPSNVFKLVFNFFQIRNALIPENFIRFGNSWKVVLES